MAKINWEISQPDSAITFTVVAKTRDQAVATAEAQFLRDTDWQARRLDIGGHPTRRTPIPDYVATKVGRYHPQQGASA